MAAFKAGDIVQLKSGGPAMTVVSVDNSDEKYFCMWFKGASRESGYFTEKALKTFVAPSAP